ncbi:MAG: hypothetical protein L0312_19245 [Acidobacteria bacterium]|nr:hypothetical protein [Acidobacteriota bacterium]
MNKATKDGHADWWSVFTGVGQAKAQQVQDALEAQQQMAAAFFRASPEKEEASQNL